jgi:PAS domain S-box-containing protein
MNKITQLMLAVIIVLFSLSGCSKADSNIPFDTLSPFSSFRDIPGVTEEDIAAIETIKKEFTSLVYGMPMGIEAFKNHNGVIQGFSAHLCEWLTNLFEIPFVPSLHIWSDLLSMLEEGTVDFTGEMRATPERRKTYFMTDTIAERIMKQYQLVNIEPLGEIAKKRILRYGLIEGSASSVLNYLESGTYTMSYVPYLSDVPGMLRSGQLDAFFHTNNAELSFIEDSDIIANDFLPIINSPVSVTTRNPKLEPVILIMQKALQVDSIQQFLTEMYKNGYADYGKHMLFTRLNTEEIAYLQNNHIVKYAAETNRYPVSFYDKHTRQWQGIAADTLKEVEMLTGLTFKIINNHQTTWPQVLSMLIDGEASMISELIPFSDRIGRFLFSDNAVMYDNYALISKADFPDIKVNEVVHARVGLLRDRLYVTMFNIWFPFHENTIEYDNIDDAVAAIDQGEIDLIMGSESGVLYLTNYHERPEFKANIVFDVSFPSTFGFNKNEEILCSIINKALIQIDTARITRHWMGKTYDYKQKLLEARRPWLIGMGFMSLVVLVLILSIFYWSLSIRKQKEAEAKIRDADERAQLMLEQAPLVVMLWDENLRIIDCNQEPLRVFGVSSKKEYIERFFELTPECQPNGMATMELAQNAFIQAFETGYNRFEWWMNHAVTGELIPFDVTSSRVKYKGKDVVITYALDLRERNAAITKMREADERTQIMFDIAPFASIMFDKNRNIIDCNQEVVKLFGIPDREFYLNNHDELFPEYQPSGELSTEVVAKNISIAFENGYYHFECMQRKLNGEHLPVEVTLVRVNYRDENVIAGYFRDLTEQKAKEQLTKIVTEKTSILSAILDATPDLVFCKDLNLRYIEINKAMENHFNTHRADIVNKTDVEAGWGAKDLMAEYNALDKKIINEQQTVAVEEYIQGFDGKRTLFETIKTPLIQDGKVTGLVGISRDITQRAEVAKLEKQQAEAEAANRAKSSFLASMSHEIRTPMNAILGITEIQLQNGDLSKETKNALSIIYNSGYTLLGIINELLDLSKIEAGKLELINNRYETASLINDTINLNMMHIGSKPIEFNLHVDENLPFELIGDELHIKQILNNLLSNAFKYTDSGVVKLSLAAEIINEINANDKSEPHVKLTIVVSDSGQGMTEEQVKNIFDAYSRFNTKANRLIEGTGLGMNIVQHLIKKMDGDISVSSVLGKGTKVTVNFMQGYSGSTVIGSKLAENLKEFRLSSISKMKNIQITREHMPYGKVLVVDDMETNLYVAKGFLLPYGLTVDTALSGNEALEKMEHGNIYDIVFMDHMMPLMDGVETAKTMRAKGYTYPIVALTANAVAGQAEMFMANGFDGFISKPIDIRELNASLNKLVRDRHPSEEVEAARAAHGAGTATVGETLQSDPELIRIFTKEAKKAIAIIESYNARDAYDEDALRIYAINVHSLKGALANIGETKLSNFAHDLEKAGREGNTAFISDKTPAFLGKLKAVVDKLISGTEENSTGDVSDEDIAYLSKMLLVIKEACAGYEKKAARSALAELRQRQWPDAYNDLLDTIAEHLLHSDFDEIVSVCMNYFSAGGKS